MTVHTLLMFAAGAVLLIAGAELLSRSAYECIREWARHARASSPVGRALIGA